MIMEERKLKKRILFALLAVVMVVALAACGGNTDADKEDANKITIESPAALINSVWSTYAEDEKFFATGGDFENMVDGEAGAVSLADAEAVNSTLHIDETGLSYVSEAAALTHAMNANTFTGAAYKLSDAANAQALVDSLKNSITSTRWMCGFPDTLIIYTVADEYVVAAFGNAEIIETFKTKLATVYGENATLDVEESLVEVEDVPAEDIIDQPAAFDGEIVDDATPAV